MITPSELSRREMLTKISALFTSLASLVLAVPIVRYLLSPIARGGQRPGRDTWISLGALSQFPIGETRLAAYRHPSVGPSDGDTAEIACWVRRVDPETVQVFAINCAHLGCPVRWFPASGLFLCPCHGGAYYADGTRASGPPNRGLFEYEYRAEGGQLLIKPGGLPTPGPSASLSTTGRPCA